MARKKDATEREVDELLDSLLEGRSSKEIMGRGGLLDALAKRVVERALEGELTDHLGEDGHVRALRSRCRGTVIGRLTRSWSGRASVGWPGSMRR